MAYEIAILIVQISIEEMLYENQMCVKDDILWGKAVNDGK